MMNLKNKKGISGVVATVLLILITISAVTIVITFIIPWVTESLEEGKICFEAKDHAKIDLSSGYTCYNSTNTILTVERAFKDITIEGFAVSIMAAGERKRYDLKESGSTSGVTMLDGTSVKIPQPGEAYTYIFNVGSGERADVAVILEKGKICETLSYSISPC